MPITEILEQNARLYGNDVALVEINPQELENRHLTWKEYSLIEPSPTDSFRSELTWSEFDAKANRLANFLLARGTRRGANSSFMGFSRPLLAVRRRSSGVISGYAARDDGTPIELKNPRKFVTTCSASAPPKTLASVMVRSATLGSAR